MEKTLQKHLRFERLISDISARFINISTDRVDREIENALREVLEFFQIDRCGLLWTSGDKASWQVTHAAFAEGIPAVPLKTHLPASLYPWVYKKLVEQREVLSFSAPEELPAEAELDKQTYREWGIRSCVNIPIFVDGADNYFRAPLKIHIFEDQIQFVEF